MLAEETKSGKSSSGIGREADRIALQHHDLKPWREKNVVRWRKSMKLTWNGWKMFWKSTKGLIIREMTVVCLDEKPVVLHHDLRRQPAQPQRPASATTNTNAAERRICCAVEPLARRHFSPHEPFWQTVRQDVSASPRLT